MTINTKFNLGDKVFFITQDLIVSDGECETCGRKMPSTLSPIRAEEATISMIKVQVYGESFLIFYEVDGGEPFKEESLFATAQEALESCQ